MAFCTGCGLRFPEDSGYRPGPPRRDDPGRASRASRALSWLTFSRVVIAVAVVVGAAGASAGATLLIGAHHAARETAQNASESTPIAAPSVQDGSASAPAPSPEPSRVGQVTIAPDVAQDPNASSVAV